MKFITADEARALTGHKNQAAFRAWANRANKMFPDSQILRCGIRWDQHTLQDMIIRMTRAKSDVGLVALPMIVKPMEEAGKTSRSKSRQ